MSAEQRAPGFAFAHMLRDQDFRQRLSMAGYSSGMTIVAVGPGISWEDAAAMADDRTPPMMLARQCDTAPHGWELRRIGQP